MQQPTESLARTELSQKIVVVVLVTFVFLSSILFFLVQHYKISQNLVSNPLKQQAVDMVKLEQEYRVKVTKIFDTYLVTVTDANLSTELAMVETGKVKKDILSLTVSPNLKDYHLSLVLALSELEQDLQTGNFSRADDQFAKIKSLVQEL